MELLTHTINSILSIEFSICGFEFSFGSIMCTILVIDLVIFIFKHFFATSD